MTLCKHRVDLGGKACSLKPKNMFQLTWFASRSTVFIARLLTVIWILHS